LQPSRNFERLQGNPIPNSSRASPNYMKKTKQATLFYKATEGGFAPLDLVDNEKKRLRI